LRRRYKVRPWETHPQQIPRERRGGTSRKLEPEGEKPSNLKPSSRREGGEPKRSGGSLCLCPFHNEGGKKKSTRGEKTKKAYLLTGEKEKEEKGRHNAIPFRMEEGEKVG